MIMTELIIAIMALIYGLVAYIGYQLESHNRKQASERYDSAEPVIQ